MDYDTLFDNETKAFIKTATSFNPAYQDELSIDDQRQFFINLCDHFHQGRPDHITITDSVINGVPTRHYNPNKAEDTPAHIVYAHGGGFVAGNLDTHDDVTLGMADRTGFALTAIDYRLAPEHRSPAALDDCRDVLAHVLQNTDKSVLIAGDSAGGYLAAMLAHEFGQKLAGQVLIYPMLGGRMNQGSYLDHGNAPMLTSAQITYYWQTYLGAEAPHEIEIMPMTASGMSHLPPAVIIGAGFDPLFSDSLQYAEKMKQAGVDITLYVEDGLPHGFMRARHATSRAAVAYDHIIEGMIALSKS